MALPKRRHSKRRRDLRRTHQKLRSISLTMCPQCKQPILPHRVCLNCGYYRGKKILLTKEERKRFKEKKKRAKE